MPTHMGVTLSVIKCVSAGTTLVIVSSWHAPPQVRARRAKAAAAERSSAEEEAYMPHSVAGSPQNSGAAPAQEERPSLDLPPAFHDSNDALHSEGLLPAWSSGNRVQRQLSAASAHADGLSGGSSPVGSAVTPRPFTHSGLQTEPFDAPAMVSSALPAPRRLSPELLAKVESGSSLRPFPRAPDSHPLSQLDLSADAAPEPAQNGSAITAIKVGTDPSKAAAEPLTGSQQAEQALQKSKPEQPQVEQGWVPSLVLPAPEPRPARHPGFLEPEVVQSSGSGQGTAPRAASEQTLDAVAAARPSSKAPLPPPPPPLLPGKSTPRAPPPPPPPVPKAGPRPPPPPAPPPAGPGPRAAPRIPAPALGQPSGPVLAMQPRVKLRGLFWSKSDKRQDTVWDVVGKGKVPMEEDHLAALEALFPATSAGPLTRSGGDGKRMSTS